MSKTQKIKLIIFDLDGVLIASKGWHFSSLNSALAKQGNQYIISEEDHLAKFDGLPTTSKLEILHQERNLPREFFDLIWKDKQEAVLELIQETVKEDPRLIEIMAQLKTQGFQLAVCSNSIRLSLNLVLHRLGIRPFFDFVYSNDYYNFKLSFPTTSKPKPSPFMYMYACMECGVKPSETLVLEDSPIGRESALEAGCCLCPVENPNAVTLGLIQRYITRENQKVTNPVLVKTQTWIGTPKMTILIPMAGQGSRFAVQGYKDIKPLIPVFPGVPMISLVCDNLNMEGKHVFIAREDHIDRYKLDTWMPILIKKPQTILIPALGPQQGACFSTMLAVNEFDNDEPLLIANSDQFVVCDFNRFMYKMMGNKECDGGMLTFELDTGDKKWSYAATDEKTGFITKIKEKEVISTHATVGIYFWKRGSDYARYAKKMMQDDSKKVNNEFYVAPVYNEAIADGKKFYIFNVEMMYGLGIPEDLQHFQHLFASSMS
jgi:HAD superfamily hydrolase (TIGR01509 family)